MYAMLTDSTVCINYMLNSQGSEEALYKRKLFCGGLNYDTVEETLKGHFEKYGEVEDVAVLRDAHGRLVWGGGGLEEFCCNQG